MARAHEVLRWLIEAGSIDEMPTLHLLRGFWGEETLHADTRCNAARADLTPVNLGLEDLDAGKAEICMRCVPFTVCKEDKDLGRQVFAAMTAIRLIAASEDISKFPNAELVPAIRAERVHQVLDYLTGTSRRGDYGLAGGILASGVEGVIREAATRHPRASHEAVMNEATRFAAIVNTKKPHGIGPEVVRALIAGQEPSEVLAVAPADQRGAVGLLIEEIEHRIVESTTRFVIIGCYPTTMYSPARSILEVAVIASARYEGHHRTVGELPSEICNAYPERPHKDNRNPHPYPLNVDWEPVTDEVIDTALILWRQSGGHDAWGNLSSAFETAIALG